MLPFNLALLVFRSTLGMGAAELTLPSHYWDGMVFQADQDQTMIWGFTTDETLMIKARTNGFIWEVIYDEVRNNGDVCQSNRKAASFSWTMLFWGICGFALDSPCRAYLMPH